MTPESKNFFDVCFSIATAIGAFTAFVIALRQWEESQRWKRSERLDQFIAQFEKDDLLRFACQVLDWTTRKVEHRGRLVKITNNDVLLALREHEALGEDGKFEGEQPLIRDSYDAFLAFYARLETAISSRLVDAGPSQAYFSYWLTRFITMDMHADENNVLQPRTPSEQARVYVRKYGDLDSIGRLCRVFKLPW